MKFKLLLFLNIIIGLAFVACATYQGKVEKTHSFIADKNWNSAIKELEPLALEPSDDQLVYLLDLATLHQMAGNFKESNKNFILADKLSDIKDYTSLSRETGAIVLNEEMLQYKGEDFEIVLINAMTAVNFLNQNDLDSALVEVRRLNEKLNRFRIEAKRKFTDNAFSHYLSGIIWESNNKWDDAFLSYEAAYKSSPQNKQVQRDLLVSAFNSRRIEAFKKYRNEISLFSEDQIKNLIQEQKNKGELIIIFESGWVPKKGFRRENYRYPQMYPVSVQTQGLKYKIFEDKNSQLNQISSETLLNVQPLFSVEQMSIQSLNDQYASLVARRFAGAVTKEVLSDQIRQKNELLGLFANIALHVTDRADLRQWSTLPAEFFVIRIPLNPGLYKIDLSGIDFYQQNTGEYDNFSFEVKENAKTFHFFRATK